MTPKNLPLTMDHTLLGKSHGRRNWFNINHINRDILFSGSPADRPATVQTPLGCGSKAEVGTLRKCDLGGPLILPES